VYFVRGHSLNSYRKSEFRDSGHRRTPKERSEDRGGG
jgi:hypothetical protein